MSSACFWCIDGKPAYGNQLGTKGDPFACCHRCHVFCCGHHGQRDNGAQKFFCFDCDKTILIVSAIQVADLQPQTVDQITAKCKRIRTADLEPGDSVLSFNDFLQRKPGYGDVLQDVEESQIDYDNWSDPVLRQIFRNFPPEAQRLLVAAAILIADTDSTEDLMQLDDPLFMNLKTSIRVPVRYG